MGKKSVESSQPTTSSKKRKVSHKGARAKGLAFERQIANELGHIFPEAKRQLEYQTDECLGTDIAGTDRIRIQCKNKQGYVSVSTIHEIRVRNEKDIPVLVTKGNKQEAMAVLPFRWLVTLLEVAYGLELPFRSFEDETPSLPSIEGPRTLVDHHLDVMTTSLAESLFKVGTGEKPAGLSYIPARSFLHHAELNVDDLI